MGTHPSSAFRPRDAQAKTSKSTALFDFRIADQTAAAPYFQWDFFRAIPIFYL
jgi:hypothetical protein